jgi:hypothetical protein
VGGDNTAIGWAEAEAATEAEAGREWGEGEAAAAGGRGWDEWGVEMGVGREEVVEENREAVADGGEVAECGVVVDVALGGLHPHNTTQKRNEWEGGSQQSW